MSHEPTTNPCFFDHTCPGDAPCPNVAVRPLPGNPPVLSVAERKLKDIETHLLVFEGATFDTSEEAADFCVNTLNAIRKILDR